MLDSVMSGFKVLFRDDRPKVIAWLKEYREYRSTERFSGVYLGMEAKYLSVEDYLKRYDKPKREASNLREAIANLQCVRAGWEFGVPLNGREEWLDVVVKAVRSFLQYE